MGAKKTNEIRAWRASRERPELDGRPVSIGAMHTPAIRSARSCSSIAAST
jgi:hypothetical protein